MADKKIDEALEKLVARLASPGWRATDPERLGDVLLGLSLKARDKRRPDSRWAREWIERACTALLRRDRMAESLSQFAKEEAEEVVAAYVEAFSDKKKTRDERMAAFARKLQRIFLYRPGSRKPLQDATRIAKYIKSRLKNQARYNATIQNVRRAMGLTRRSAKVVREILP